MSAERSLMQKAHDFTAATIGECTEEQARRAYEAYLMNKTDPRNRAPRIGVAERHREAYWVYRRAIAREYEMELPFV